MIEEIRRLSPPGPFRCPSSRHSSHFEQLPFERHQSHCWNITSSYNRSVSAVIHCSTRCSPGPTRSYVPTQTVTQLRVHVPSEHIRDDAPGPVSPPAPVPICQWAGTYILFHRVGHHVVRFSLFFEAHKKATRKRRRIGM